ncbi:hypothetical protein ACFV8T_37830 [Streptomyces sp. NPDC059832]
MPTADGSGRRREVPSIFIDIPARRQVLTPPELPEERCSSSSAEP